ncbi:hypothetical protein PP178_04290 [Zeaxanthinibacter sp. PT1]|uniref:hypothetical protein n=1 Tax=Zeaxanthinibacter TaxID=561554 RepID=UPI002349FBC9|nr:hypothetical protein [Zeaxanthinibacter sp. PT1]MDC6350759.1 hypothetical protein [Zeaxanthinibacter sp. PT1]
MAKKQAKKESKEVNMNPVPTKTVPFFPQFSLQVSDPKSRAENDEELKNREKFIRVIAVSSRVRCEFPSDKGENFRDVRQVYVSDRFEVSEEEWSEKETEIRTRIIMRHLKQCALTFKYIKLPSEEHLEKVRQHNADNFEFHGTYPANEIMMHI